MAEYRLLVIEDNQNIADMICLTASEMGFGARYASGNNAPFVYDEFKPDVIVLDILMPEMDGLEFLQFLQKQGAAPRVVILSGSSDSYRKIAENIGISGGLIIEANLSKPFRISEVRAVLEKIKISLKAVGNPKENTA